MTLIMVLTSNSMNLGFKQKQVILLPDYLFSANRLNYYQVVLMVIL